MYLVIFIFYYFLCNLTEFYIRIITDWLSLDLVSIQDRKFA